MSGYDFLTPTDLANIIRRATVGYRHLGENYCEDVGQSICEKLLRIEVGSSIPTERIRAYCTQVAINEAHAYWYKHALPVSVAVGDYSAKRHFLQSGVINPAP